MDLWSKESPNSQLRQLTQSLGIDYGALLAVVYAALR